MISVTITSPSVSSCDLSWMDKRVVHPTQIASIRQPTYFELISGQYFTKAIQFSILLSFG